jgi:excisionase family DNA binding protein
MQPNTKIQTVLLTPRETAARLRVSESTLAKWRMTAARALPYIKIGAKVAYNEVEVEKWLVARMRRSTSDTSVEAA